MRDFRERTAGRLVASLLHTKKDNLKKRKPPWVKIFDEA